METECTHAHTLVQPLIFSPFLCLCSWNSHAPDEVPALTHHLFTRSVLSLPLVPQPPAQNSPVLIPPPVVKMKPSSVAEIVHWMEVSDLITDSCPLSRSHVSCTAHITSHMIVAFSVTKQDYALTRSQSSSDCL